MSQDTRCTKEGGASENRGARAPFLPHADRHLLLAVQHVDEPAARRGLERSDDALRAEHLKLVVLSISKRLSIPIDIRLVEPLFDLNLGTMKDRFRRKDIELIANFNLSVVPLKQQLRKMQPDFSVF